MPVTPSRMRCLQKILRNDFQRQSKEAKPEQPLVVLMAPLDREQVRLFAEGQGVQQLDDFMNALDRDNLSGISPSALWILGGSSTTGERTSGSAGSPKCWKRASGHVFQEENPAHGSRDEIGAEAGNGGVGEDRRDDGVRAD